MHACMYSYVKDGLTPGYTDLIILIFLNLRYVQDYALATTAYSGHIAAIFAQIDYVETILAPLITDRFIAYWL